MEKHDTSFLREEVNSIVSTLQKLLPRKKDLIVVGPQRSKLTTLNHIHAEAKNVFPKCFIGAKLIILREIMDKVKLVQNYNFGKSKESYKSFPPVVNKEMEIKRADDGLLIDSTGSATATYTETLHGVYEMRLTSKIRDLVSSETELTFEKENVRSVGSVSFSMRDVDPNTLKMVTQYMYNLFPEFSLGTEIAFKPLSYPPKPDMSVSARYERPSFVMSSTVSRAGFQLCMYNKFASDLRIATVVTDCNRTAPATIGLALHKSYSNGSELKIFVDSQKCGGFTFQKDIMFYEPHNEVRVLRLVCSTVLDRQRRVRLGLGFHLDF